MEYFDLKLKDFGQKTGQTGFKMTPKAADGSHGALGRMKEGKNGLEDGETSWNIDPLLQGNIIFLLFTGIELCISKNKFGKRTKIASPL